MLEMNEEACYAQILKDFDKTKQDLDEYIDIIQKWAKTQPHFPEEPSYLTVRFVVLFNKFSIEKAKQKLDMYYTIRGLLPEYFDTPFSLEMAVHNKMWQIVPLPKVADNYIRIIYHRLNPEFDDPKYFDHGKELACFLAVIEVLILEDNCYRLHYILDLKGTKMGHIVKLSPVVMKNAAVILEKVYSNNLSSMYFVNSPPFYESVLNTMIKPVLNPKIRERIKTCTGTDILLKDFGKECMPKDIGGDEKSIHELNVLLMEKYEKHRNRFEKLASMRVNESLRPTKLENDEVLGYYGNFKKVNVD